MSIQVKALGKKVIVNPIPYGLFDVRYTVKPLNTDTPRDEQKCPSYRGVRLIEVIFNRNLPLGHR